MTRDAGLGTQKPTRRQARTAFGPADVRRAASAAFTWRSLAASALVLFFPLMLAAAVSRAIQSVEPEGSRRVLEHGPALLTVIAAGGCVALNAQLARRRIDSARLPFREEARRWATALALCAGVAFAFGAVFLAFQGILALLKGGADFVPVLDRALRSLRVIPIALAALAVASLAALAFVVTYLSAILAVEQCSTSDALDALKRLWRRASADMLLHFALIGLAAAGMGWVMSELTAHIFGLAGGESPPPSWWTTLYEVAMFRTLSWMLPLSMLGTFGVASYLALQADGPDSGRSPTAS
ncbi:MAG: hypothetical protein HY716_14910 [Planctomycetes bacterium]|nr:hypothetical protein [Planctomycetota bacterium]